MADQVLERFHRALIEEIQTQQPRYLSASFTVAEIYQSLVPYGSHRDRIGVEMNGDYEHALLRMLGGEGGFLILDSEPALRDIQAELESSNPNTGLFREFAAVEVRLNPNLLDLAASLREEIPSLVDMLEAAEVVEEPAEEDLTEEDLAEEDAAALEPVAEEPEAEQAQGDELELEVEAAEVEAPVGALSNAAAAVEDQMPNDEAVVAPGASVSGEVSCSWCDADLPARASVNFCPFCGKDQTLHPCPSCGDAMEDGWRFCVVCGTDAGA
jgi:hypothetical protein